jgi:hypothetical protein
MMNDVSEKQKTEKKNSPEHAAIWRQRWENGQKTAKTAK